MESILANLLQNCKMDDTMFQTCISFLSSSSLEEEQYEMIMEVCQEKLDEKQLNKYITHIQNINKELISGVPEKSPLANFINNIYNIKAYINDENDITEKNPTIEHVIEMNFNKKNITFFHITIYDNIKDEKTTDISIQIQDESDDESDIEMKESDSDSDNEMKESESGSDSEMDTANKNALMFDGNNCQKKFIEYMNWDLTETKEQFNIFVNNIFKAFDSEDEIIWKTSE